MRVRVTRLVLLAVTPGVLAGCAHLGPNSVVDDRIAYNHAVADSWQQQTLLNIVRSRYNDTPVLVDVSQIIAGYQGQYTLSADAAIAPTAAVLRPPASDRFTSKLGLQTTYVDRPTITYAPQTGAQFIRNLTGPLEPSAVLFMIQAGYPADLMLELVVESINGIPNFSSSGGETREADPRFRRVMELMRRAQQSAGVGMRIERDKQNNETVVFIVRDKNIDPESARDLTELRTILGLEPAQGEYRVVYGATAKAPNEIAMLTRSVFRMYTVLSTFVDVPVCHQIDGRATPVDRPACANPDEPLVEIRSGPKPPADCFTAIRYRGHWFWVDDRSARTKRVFSFLLAFQSLADTRAREGLPVVTIQAN